MSRQIILDTETTGLSPQAGHRLIEIGGIELIDRCRTGNDFHSYINPERDIDAGAVAVHGITREFLDDKPLFASIAAELIQYLDGAELIIHNAPFDIGFIDYELERLKQGFKSLKHYCTVFDTLPFARKKHPGQRNTLDALCKRYSVDNSGRDFHGALLDADLLADVFLAMTREQTTLLFSETDSDGGGSEQIVAVREKVRDRKYRLKIRTATAAEASAHAAFLEKLENE